MSTPRKQHAADAGYIAERRNPIMPGTKVVIYLTAEQVFVQYGDIKIWGDKEKYAVYCKAHQRAAGASSQQQARLWMKRPDEFCDECKKALYAQMEDK